MPRTFVDITGNMFGDLVAIRPLAEKKGKSFSKRWECKCNRCGSVKSYDGSSLRKKTGTRNCGCKRAFYDRVGKYGVLAAHWNGIGELSGTLWRRTLHSRDRPSKNNLPIEYGWQLFLEQGRKCALTGIELTMGPKCTQATASLDRIDSSKGYEIGNVQWVHKDVNRMKNAYNQEYFIEICRLVAQTHP